jgi:hypothetical protein
MIKVLMIDDQVELMQEFVGQAVDEEIIIELVSSHQEGVEKIESQPFGTYDAVILDADVKTSKDSVETSLSGLIKSLDYLNKIAYQQQFYPYIFTGQPDKLDKAQFKEIYGRDYYLKGRDEEKLIQDILNDNANTHKKLIDQKLPILREAFHSTSLESKHLEFFYKLFLRVFSLGPFHESDANQIRKAYESLLKELIDQHLIIDDFLNAKGQPNFTWLRYLLTTGYDRNTGYKFDFEVGNQTKSAIELLDSIVQAYSHQNKETYFGNMIPACAFAFLEFLTWHQNLLKKTGRI